MGPVAITSQHQTRKEDGGWCRSKTVSHTGGSTVEDQEDKKALWKHNDVEQFTS